MDQQFYPTPAWLAEKARDLFNEPVRRLLEPSAGKGSLLTEGRRVQFNPSKVDVIEIDPVNQATLRGMGFKVVGHDFLEFQGGAMYSHILLNPPFSHGVDHVLHAWNLLHDGEIVAIINAESLRNPYSVKRQHLAKLVQEHGSVEFIDGAFDTGEEERSANVDVALIHLRKVAEGINFTDGLEVEETSELDTGNDKELALKGSSIPAIVNTFRLAVEALRAAAMAEAKAVKLASHLEKSIVDPTVFNREEGDIDPLLCGSFSEVKAILIENFNKGYDQLKERAWSTVLRSADIQSRLTSKAKQALVADFEKIKELEFTVKNIYGFLSGVVNSQADMTNAMLCEVFDRISMYHPKNRAYYRGWKSNAKHRIFAFRIQMTRFVLPLWNEPYSTFVSHSDAAWLEDIDKVFAYLDAKDYVRDKDQIKGILWAFQNRFRDLVDGERVETDYFDLRYYRGVNTVHFYPRRKDLVDRLNRFVGKLRAWIPETVEPANSAFWEQYQQAEKITKGMKRSERTERRLSQLTEMALRDKFYYDKSDRAEYERLCNEMDREHSAMLEKLGIDEARIESCQDSTPLLESVA